MKTEKGKGVRVSRAAATDVVLRGESVELHSLTEAHIPALATLLAESEVQKWWGNFTAPEILELLDDESVHAFAIIIDGDVAGIVMYGEEDDPDYRHANVDIAIGVPWQGRGLGRDALGTMLVYLFGELAHHRVTIDPRADNSRAIGSYTSLGFRPIGLMREYERGVDGIWHDAMLMELLARYFTK